MNNENPARVHVSKQFGASREKLYNAWTNPEELKKWWRPMDKQLVNVENDIRQGGKVIYEFENDLKIEGEYKEVAEGQRLVYSWNWELPEEGVHRGEYLLTIQFNENSEGSTLEVTQENFKNEHSVKPHQEGWDEALEDLRKFLQSDNA